MERVSGCWPQSGSSCEHTTGACPVQAINATGLNEVVRSELPQQDPEPKQVPMSEGIWEGLRGPVQIAYAVEDMDRAMEWWVARGVGPFFARHHIELDKSRMWGRSAAFDFSAALGQWGDVMVELICEHHEVGDRVGPSVGIHHLAFFVDDIAASQRRLIDHGWAEALFAEVANSPFALHDATVELGHLIEIYHEDTRRADLFELVRSSALDWDGSDGIRLL
jgi:catechol 2,3-dioxygenase-like lactoylglutathione lyase family enzyme